VSRARIVKVSALVAGAMLALSGCGQHPGSAAVVGDTRITDGTVDDAASALCSANITGAAAQGQPKPDLATRGARQAALSLLIDSELSRQYGAAKGIVPSRSEVSSALAQNKQTITLLPENRKEDFTELLRGYVEGQLVTVQAGQAQVGDGAPQEEAMAAGTQLRNEWAASQGIEVEVDPRYGEYAEGSLAGTSGSLSFPVSQRAVAGANSEPGAEWVAGLPLSQKCS
jgi:hypothetical protein